MAVKPERSKKTTYTEVRTREERRRFRELLDSEACMNAVIIVQVPDLKLTEDLSVGLRKRFDRETMDANFFSRIIGLVHEAIIDDDTDEIISRCAVELLGKTDGEELTELKNRLLDAYHLAAALSTDREQENDD